jgi:chemotaxis protein methyltransferase CheR
MQDKFKMFCEDEAIYYRKNFGKAAMPRANQEKSEQSIEQALEEISLKHALAEIDSELKKIPTPQKVEDILVDAVKYYHMKEYDKALKLLDEARTLDRNLIEPFYISAEIFLSQGKFNEAKTKLTQALNINPLFAAAHYLFGCIFLEQNSTDSAKESLKKALYIDKNFSLAHFYLAQAYKAEAKNNEAIREYRNTTKLLSRLSTDDIIPFSGGFNVATILSVCRDNIERLKLESH